jgi:Ca-activated chloride channel family protein
MRSLAGGLLGAERFEAHDAGADAGALPGLHVGEELWIIARDDGAQHGEPRDAYPALRARVTGEPREIPLPLVHTEVDAHVAGYVASVRVKQQYENPYASKIEAVYVFPLPEDAAVNEFLMVIAERRIRGIIRERVEAEQIYQQAKHQGYVASLLTQERPNVFTQSVANIEPGKAIEIDLTYFHTLDSIDGEYELVFPMVVGPRFNPPGSQDGIGAAPRGGAGASAQSVEAQYLDPDAERSGHDVSLRVDIAAGMKIEALHSPSHEIETKLDGERATVELAHHDRVPNKDFVLRYRLGGDMVKSAFLTHRDERGGFFTLMLEPPASLAKERRHPMELIFVLDCSGSMAGKPLEIAKGAAERALGKLGPDDTFQIIEFSDHASQLGPEPLQATRENVRRGIEYLHGLHSGGGTMMNEGILAALDFAHNPKRLRIVSFMTDGFIGNEAQILETIRLHVGDARIFSLGVGSSTNRYLLERMALLGRGAAAFVGLHESFNDAIDGFYERASHPALADLEIDWGALDVTDVYPQRIPDLFVGRPIIVTGRLRNAPDGGEILVRGRVAGERKDIVVRTESHDGDHPALASIWARTRIADLEDGSSTDGWAAAAGEIKTVALEYDLMSAYTAFVAVDSSAQTAGAHGTTVVQPVPVPDGVQYETTVSER